MKKICVLFVALLYSTAVLAKSEQKTLGEYKCDADGEFYGLNIEKDHVAIFHVKGLHLGEIYYKASSSSKWLPKHNVVISKPILSVDPDTPTSHSTRMSHILFDITDSGKLVGTYVDVTLLNQGGMSSLKDFEFVCEKK